MRIKSIKLLNGYKRFKNLTINLGGRPKKIVALVGPNGSGKSSVFDGMLFLANHFHQIGQFAMKDFKYHSMDGNQVDHRNIEISFDNGEDFQTAFERRRQTRAHSTIFNFRNAYRFNSNLLITSLEQVPDIEINKNGASTSADLDDKMTQNYQRLYSYINKYRKEHDLTDNQAKDQVIGDLNRILSICLGLEISDHGEIIDGRGSLYFKKSNQPIEFEFNVLSSGEKEVVDILLDIYLKREIYNDTIYIIDEPELHLNTSIQRKLLVEIEKLIPESCQLWVATHSIGFLSALQQELNDKSDIIDFNGDLSSAPVTLEPMVKSRANWQNIFKTALEDLTGLIAPRTIIYCEGKDKPGKEGEEKGFDAKVYNNIFSSTYPDTLFVSSGGNTELDQRSEIAIIILTKILNDVEILVLKDRDVSSGKQNTENDRRIYLENNPQNHRILNRWEIENYLFDKEVLMEYCRQNDKVFNEVDYDRFITDIVNQNIKGEIGRIKNFCSIITSVNPEVFKLNLSKVITKEMRVYQELENSIFKRL